LVIDGSDRYDGPVSNPSDNPFASGDADKPISEPIRHHAISARVPERCARGVYSTGQLVLDGPKEFVIDFLQGLTRPFQINARVIMTPSTMSEFVNALTTNLENYTKTFGPPPSLPVPQPHQRPTIQEIYDNYKLPDEMLSGSYANQVLIGHSPTEFFFDFITGFYPTPAISSRVYIPAAVVPRFLNTIRTVVEQYRKRFGDAALQSPQSPRPDESPPPPPADPPSTFE
jgi:hypothetical protein